MNANPLFALEPPHLHSLTASTSEMWDFASSLKRTPGIERAVRIVRGAKSQALNNLFDEFAAALQFPYYFGENWAALDECLADLDWLAGDAYILFFTDSQQLLHEEPPSQLKTLLNVLESVAGEWSEPHGRRRDGERRAFHVVFQCSKEETAAFLARIHDLGRSLSQLRVP